MIEGELAVVGGVGEVVWQNIRRCAVGEIGYDLIEAKFKLNAAGELSVELPYLAGQPLQWALVRGTGDEQPAEAFTLRVTALHGERLRLVVGNIVNNQSISADVAVTSLTSQTVNRCCGPLVIAVVGGSVANAGKTFSIAMAFLPSSRTLT